MFKLRLIALTAVLFTLAACEKDDDTKLTPDRSRHISNYDFLLTPQQVVPAQTVASTASGRIEGSYDRRTRVFTYTLYWTGLSSTVTAIHIHGIAERGMNAIPVAPLASYTNGIVQTTFGNPTTTTNSYSGSLYVDGTVVREQDLLANKFYVDIHTTNYPVATAGELRGQIIFP